MKLVFVRDKGQMCNNIVQFAHAYAWAREHGVRAVSLRFAYKYRYFRICGTAWHNPLVYLVVKFLVWIGLLHDLEYNSLSTDFTPGEEKALRRRLPTVMSGWHVRHNDLVEKYEDELREMFALTDGRQRKVDETFAEMTGEGSSTIGLHVRRGDYKTFMGGKYMLDDEQYIDAVKRTMRLKENARWTVIVCTNDDSLDIEHYRQALAGAEVRLSKGNAWTDLGLLAKCDYVVGVPSSFTLVATLYGHARLHWLSKEDTAAFTEESFYGFVTGLRTMDGWFGGDEVRPRRQLFLISRLLDGGIDTVLLQYLDMFAKDKKYEVTLAIGCNMGELEVFRDRIPEAVKVEYLVENKTLCQFRIDRFKRRTGTLRKLFGEMVFTTIERRIKARRIRQLEREADIVIDFDACHTAYLSDSDRPTYGWLHFSVEKLMEQNSRRTRRILKRLGTYTRVVTICRAMAEEVERMAPEIADRIECVYNPIDRSRLEAMAEEPLETDKPYILAVERLEESQKDISTLLRAYAMIDVAQDLVVVGKGADEQKLKNLAGELGISDRVRFAGFQSNPYKWMRHADLLVHSAKFEGFPTTLVEALAIGTQIVATDCPTGPREILDDGKAGRLVPVGDAQAMASAISEALKQGADAEQAHHAQAHSKRYTQEVIKPQLETMMKG
ncbi:MAG: glycosyltransferase [Bacteroidaceae bacterium]|nr:glycosyltransferase [Bacteroidaceae bacterium]